MSLNEDLGDLDRTAHDWSVSGDAMRSIPHDAEPVIAPTWHPAYVVPAQRQSEPGPESVEPFVASRRQVIPLLNELGHRIVTELCQRRR